MVGLLLRLTCSALAIALALVTPVLAVATATPASADTVVDGCTIVSNPTPTNFTNCPGADLSRATLSGDDLSFANLAGANLSGANLTGIAQISPTVVITTGTNFSGANLTDANLGAAALGSCMVVNGTPTLQAVDCFAATFSGAILAGAQLNGTDLGGISFDGADLTGADLNSVTEPGCFTLTLGNTQVTECVGPNLTNANLTNAILSSADLSNSTLSGANFTGTVLVPANQTVIPTSQSGAAATWSTPPSLPGATPGSCTPSSGSTFPIGVTSVICPVLDDQGDVASGTFTVTVNVPPPPATSALLPANGATVIGSTWLDAVASSPVGISSVTFEVSGGPNAISDQVVGAGSPTLFGYIGGWDTTDVPNGTYTLQSVATDTRGQSTTSAPVTVTVDNLPLQTTVIIPSDGATLSGSSAVLDAVAAGTSDVTGMQFEVTGGTLTDQVVATGTATIYGWLAVWDTTTIPNGTYTLNSVATEVGGTTATSPGLTVTVAN